MTSGPTDTPPPDAGEGAPVPSIHVTIATNEEGTYLLELQTGAGTFVSLWDQAGLLGLGRACVKSAQGALGGLSLPDKPKIITDLRG